MPTNNLRLRAINAGQGPVSTMNRNPTIRTSRDLTDASDERPTKRQKQVRATGTKSDFFVDLSQGGREGYQDLTKGASRSQGWDPIEVLSASSAGKNVAATSGQQEYRKATSQNSFKPRSRRRRPAKSPSLAGQQSNEIDLVGRDSTPVDGNKGNAQLDDSPDVIISSPPPANVISDLASHRQKRSRPTNLVDSTQPAVKRPRNHGKTEEIESDDELAEQTPKAAQSHTRISNFYQITGRSKPQANRGDIKKTDFKFASSPKKGVPSSSPSGDLKQVQIASAAGGKFTHPAKDAEETSITFTLGKVGASAQLDGQGSSSDLSWLTVTPNKISTVQHKLTISSYVIIKQSSSETTPPILCLKFVDKEHATDFIHWLSDFSTPKFQETESERLENTFNNTFSKSEAYISQASHRPRSNETEDNHIDGHNQARFAPSNLRGSEHRDPFRPTTGDSPVERVDRKPRLISQMEGNQGMETRRTRRTSPIYHLREPSPLPERWTVSNPDWHKKWQKSLVYPATGKNRTTVDKDDILRLDEGEFLNDNLINFYFRYLQDILEIKNPDVLKNIYFFSTFFYEKLRSNRSKLNYDGVKSWTAKVDLLSYKYIIVPVNENAHWYLAIIYNAPRMLPDEQEAIDPLENATINAESFDPRSSPGMATVARDISFISLEDEPIRSKTRSEKTAEVPESSPATITTNRSQETSAKGQGRRSIGGGLQKTDVDSPRIITLDSLGSPHSPTCRFLKEYLIQEAKNKKDIELTNLPSGMTAKNIPEQNNYCDCGVFILGYMEEFLKDPDEAIRKLLLKENLGWQISPAATRSKVRSLLNILQEEQQLRLDQEQKEKKERKEKRARMKEQAAAKSVAPPKDVQEDLPKQASEAPAPAQENQEEQSTTELEPTVATNGVEPGVEQQERSSEEPPPLTLLRPSSPPSRTMTTPVRKSMDEVKFISPLGDANEEAPDSSINVYVSARTSPVKKPETTATVDLTTSEEKPVRSPATPNTKKRRHEFVRTLSISSDEASRSRAKLHERRTASPEVSMVKRTRRQIEIPAPYLDRDSHVQLVPSIESDHPPTPPTYEGIDRSIDLTASQ